MSLSLPGTPRIGGEAKAEENVQGRGWPIVDGCWGEDSVGKNAECEPLKEATGRPALGYRW